MAVSLSLVLVEQTGHPPPMILVPPVLLVWLVGHGVIWGAQQLAARGRRRMDRPDSASRSWPIALRLVLVATGIVALAGIAQVLGSALMREWYPYQYAGMWAAMAVVSLLHGLCFAGVLLRHGAARSASALLAVGWAILMGKQVWDGFRAPAVDTGGLLFAVALIVALLLFARHLVVSDAVRSFFPR